MRRFAVTSAMFLAASARADIAPEEPVRPCTLATYASKTSDCFECTASASGAVCKNSDGADLGFMCRGGGGESWPEIHCRTHRRVTPSRRTSGVLGAVTGVTASSSMASSKTYAFDPSQLVDEDLTTSW